MSSSTASDKGWSLSLDNRTLDISGNGSRGTVTCYGYRKILRVTNCEFYGSAAAATGVSTFAGQTLLDIGGTQDISDTAHQVVDNCLFEGGSLAFNLAGTNQPGPLIYTNNQHFNQRSEEHTSEHQSLMRIS